jgi:hypothetical protein
MQNCVIEQFPKVEDYLPFLYCIQGMATLNNALPKCLENQARIDVNRSANRVFRQTHNQAFFFSER